MLVISTTVQLHRYCGGDGTVVIMALMVWVREAIPMIRRGIAGAADYRCRNAFSRAPGLPARCAKSPMATAPGCPLRPRGSPTASSPLLR